MKKLDKEYIKKLANDLMFEFSEEELNNVEVISETFMEHLAILNKIDTDNTEAMHYPFAQEVNYLREDIVNHELKREDVLKNAPKTDGEYFEVVQVIDK